MKINFSKMPSEKFDRTTFRHQTAKEASHQLKYWQKKSYEERLETANYLNSVAYNFEINNPPKMDKSFFKIKSRK
jgi:hypothetical protein